MNPSTLQEASTLVGLSPGSAMDTSSMPSAMAPAVLLDRVSLRLLEAPIGTLAPTPGQNGTDSEHTHGLGVGGTDSVPGGEYRAGSILPSIIRPAVAELSFAGSPSLYPKQEWAGRVTAIYDDEFDARLRDVAADEFAVATIALEEIGPDDRAQLRVGSLFRWVMGHERSVGGTRSNVSRIVFLDPPRLTERDLEVGRMWADQLRSQWGLD